MKTKWIMASELVEGQTMILRNREIIAIAVSETPTGRFINVVGNDGYKNRFAGREYVEIVLIGEVTRRIVEGPQYCDKCGCDARHSQETCEANIRTLNSYKRNRYSCVDGVTIQIDNKDAFYLSIIENSVGPRYSYSPSLKGDMARRICELLNAAKVDPFNPSGGTLGE